MWQTHHLAVTFVRCKNIHTHGSDVFGKRHNKFFADGVDCWIRYLCKLLAEIVEQQLWTFVQHSQWCVITHGSNWFGAIYSHGYKNTFHILTRVSENFQHGVIGRDAVLHLSATFQGI